MAGTEPEPGAEPSAEASRQAGRRSRAKAVDLGQLFESMQSTDVARQKTLTNSLGMPFVLIPAGGFQMGSPDSEPGHRTNEGPVHEVVLSKPFYLAIHPVTQRAYEEVMGRNPSRFTTANGGGPVPRTPRRLVAQPGRPLPGCLPQRPRPASAGLGNRVPRRSRSGVLMSRAVALVCDSRLTNYASHSAGRR